jgi:hypothetical protein
VGAFSLPCELDGLKNELEVWDCNSIAWDLGVYTLALARRRLGIPIGSDAAAERWSVSSVDVSLTAACPLLPLALWALAGSHSPFCCELHFPFAHNEQSFAVPTVGPHSVYLVEKGVLQFGLLWKSTGFVGALTRVH